MSKKKQKDEIEMLYLDIENKERVQQIHSIIAKIEDTISGVVVQIRKEFFNK